MPVKEFKSFIGINEMRDYKILFKQIFAEFLGTFLYISLVLLAGTQLGTGTVTTALANGLLVATIMQIIGQVSGGHINPAVTIGAMMCGHIRLLKAVCYVIFQILGAIAGAAVSYAVTTSDTRGLLGVTVPNEQLRADQIFALEFLMTFLLVAVFISVVDLRRGARGLGSAALAVGLSITGCQCACLPYTGSLNPVRTFGPAVMMNVWDQHWAYWVGPICGGVCAGLVSNFIFLRQRDDDNDDD